MHFLEPETIGVGSDCEYSLQPISSFYLWRIIVSQRDWGEKQSSARRRTPVRTGIPFPKFPFEKWGEPHLLWRAVSAKRKHRLWDTHSPVPTPPSGMPTPASIPNQSRTSSWKGDYRRPGLSLLEPGTYLPHLEWSRRVGVRRGLHACGLTGDGCGWEMPTQALSTSKNWRPFS